MRRLPTRSRSKPSSSPAMASTRSPGPRPATTARSELRWTTTCVTRRARSPNPISSPRPSSRACRFRTWPERSNRATTSRVCRPARTTTSRPRLATGRETGRRSAGSSTRPCASEGAATAGAWHCAGRERTVRARSRTGPDFHDARVKERSRCLRHWSSRAHPCGWWESSQRASPPAGRSATAT